MPKSFGDWMKDLSGSIEDRSTVVDKKKSIQDDLRKKAFIYATLNHGEPKDGHDVTKFFLSYCEYVAGIDVYEEFERIDSWSDDFDLKMIILYKRLEKFVGIAE